jgi:hypothetical protein
LKCNITITVKQKCNHTFLLVSRGNLVFTSKWNINSATLLSLYFQIMDRQGVENPQQQQWGRPQGQQVPPGQANHPPQLVISPHNAEELEAIQNGWEKELRVERGWMNALRMLEATRERMQLAIKVHSREHAEWEARQARVVAMQHRVNIEFNNQAKFIFNWLRKRIKRTQFCRSYKNSWTDICQKKIAGLKMFICWCSGVIYRNMKKQIKERVLIGK